jgi:hypothetical protein
VPHGHGELRRDGKLTHVGSFIDGLADGFGIENVVSDSPDSPAPVFTRKAFFRRGRADGVGADVIEESDGTETVLRVVLFANGDVEREIADHHEAELILSRLFHAEQRMFAASKVLSQRWAVVSAQLETIQSSIAELLSRRRSKATLVIPQSQPPSAMQTAANSPETSPEKPRRRKSIADGRQLTASSQAIRAMADQVLAATPPASPQIGAAARADFKTARVEELNDAAESPGGERRKLRGGKKPSYGSTSIEISDAPASPTRARPTRGPSGSNKSLVALPPMAKLEVPPPTFDDSVLTPRRFATLMPASVVTVQLVRERVWPGDTLTGAVHVEIPRNAVLEECKIAFVARTEALDGSGARSGGSRKVFRVRKVLVAQEKPLRHGLHSLPFSFTTRSDMPPSGASSTVMRAQTLRNNKSGASESSAPLPLTRDNVSRSLRRALVTIAETTQAMAYSLEVTLKFGKRPMVLYRHRVVIAERSLEPSALEHFNRASLDHMLATLDSDMERECQAVSRRYEEQVDLLLEAMMVHEVMCLSQPYTYAMALAQSELARRLAQ